MSAASESNTALVSTMQNSSAGSPNTRTLEVPSANNEQGRCIERGTDSPGTLGMFGGYGVENPRAQVSDRGKKSVNS